MKMYHFARSAKSFSLSNDHFQGGGVEFRGGVTLKFRGEGVTFKGGNDPVTSPINLPLTKVHLFQFLAVPGHSKSILNFS